MYEAICIIRPTWRAYGRDKPSYVHWQTALCAYRIYLIKVSRVRDHVVQPMCSNYNLIRLPVVSINSSQMSIYFTRQVKRRDHLCSGT